MSASSEIQIIQEQLARMYSAIASLKTEVLPKSRGDST